MAYNPMDSVASVIAYVTGRVEYLEGLVNGLINPTVYFVAATLSVLEPDSGFVPMVITAKRSNKIGALSVTATFDKGTTDAADYGGTLPGDLTFNFVHGSDTATKTINVSGDLDVESNETFSYQLVAPAGYTLATPNKFTGTILNNDAPAMAGDFTALRVRDATPLDPDTGSPSIGVDGNGYVAEVTVKGLTAPAADSTSDSKFDPTKLELLVADPAFDANCNPTTMYRKIYGRAVMRKPYKTSSSDTSQRFITQVGSDFVVFIVLSDQLYKKSVIVSAKVSSGFYTNGGTTYRDSVATNIVNASTYEYKKPTAAWLNTPHINVRSSTYGVELIAFHRHAMGGRQVAGVKIQARDTTGNTTPEITVNSTSLSKLITQSDAPKAESYQATLDLTNLKQAELCFVNAKVYPWIGDSASVYDLSVHGTNTDLTRTQDASPHTRLRFFNDKNNVYSGAVLVDATVSYTPICSASSFNPATNAFDGNYTSGYGWLSQNGGTDQWVGQTFPVAVNIEEVRLWASGYGANNTFNNFDLEWSDDGTTWTKKGATQTSATWTTAYTQTQTFNPGGAARAARYWRIRQNGKTASGSFTGAQEVEFAMTAGGWNMSNGMASDNLTAARMTPVTSVDSAFKAIRTYNARKGHDDYAGARIYLANPTGAAVEYGALANVAVPAAPGNTWCEILPDPTAVGKVVWTGKAVLIKYPSMMRLVNLVMRWGASSNFTTLADAESTSGTSMLSLEGVNFEANASGNSITGSSGLYGFGLSYRTNCRSELGTVLTIGGAANEPRQLALALGNVHGPSGSTVFPAHIMVGNKCVAPPGNSEATGFASYTDGYFWVSNEFRYSDGPAYNLKSVTRPTVIAQNLCEFYGNTNGGIISWNMSADNVITPVFELLDMHNTRLGNRGSRMYTDAAGARGIIKEGVSIGNIDGNYNIKTDTFSGGLPGNVGNWRYLHQLGLRSNVSLMASLGGTTPGTGSYLGMAWEPKYSDYNLAGSVIENAMALFVNYQAQRNGSGAYPGYGDYHLTGSSNGLYNKVPAVFAAFDAGFTNTLSGATFKYDLDGKLRRFDGKGAVGCYERTDLGDVTSPESPIPNPTTAKVYGPSSAGDTGYQEVGATTFAFSAEASNEGTNTGVSGELLIGVDTTDGNPNVGLRFSQMGLGRYWQCHYRKDGAWVQFGNSRGFMNWGASNTFADNFAINIPDGELHVYKNGNEVRLAGNVAVLSQANLATAFPNGLGKYIRWSDASASNGKISAWKVKLAGGNVEAITAIDVSFDSAQYPVFTFRYTGTPLGYITRILDNTGAPITPWGTATKISNTAAGQAVYRGAQKALASNIVYRYEMAEVDSNGGPKAGVPTLIKTLIAPGPMQFGVNIAQDRYSNNPRRDRCAGWRCNFTSGNYDLHPWNDATNPQLDAFNRPTPAAITQIMQDNSQPAGTLTTGPNVSPPGTKYPVQSDGSGKGPVLEIAPPRLRGQRTRLKWKGVAGNMSSGDFNNIGKNITTGTDGTYCWFDYDHMYDPSLYLTRGAASDATVMLIRVSSSGGVFPTEITAYDIDADGNPTSTGYWDPVYIDDQRKYLGHTTNGPRFMDVQKIIGMHDRVFSASHIIDGMSRLPDGGWGYEMCFSFLEAAGLGGQVHIPLQADESFVRKAARLGAVWSARTKLVVAWELSNEIWNSRQFSYHTAYNLGKAMGFTAYKSDGQGGQVEDENGIRMQYNSFRHRQVMQWVTDEYSKVPGASQYLRRVLGCWNNVPSNSISVALSDPLCLDFTDELQSAPYLGNGMAASYPQTPADITDAMLDEVIAKIKNESLPTVFAYAAQIRDFALSKGKTFGGYEGLLEDLGNGELLLRLKRDNVRWPDLVTYILSEYKRLVGGHYRLYYDNSGSWGLRGHISSDWKGSINSLPVAGGMKAFYDFMSAQPTV